MVNQVQGATAGPAPLVGGQAADPNAIAGRVLADNGGTLKPDLPKIRQVLDAVSAIDGAIGDQVQVHIERALGPVKSGELARVAYTVDDGRGTSVAFAAGAPTIAQYRAMPAGSPGRDSYMALDRAFGDGRYATDDTPRIDAGLRDMKASGLPLDRVLARPAIAAAPSVGDVLGRVSPAGLAMEAMRPVVAALGREAGLSATSWGAPLQRVLDTPGSARAFNAGVADGILGGAKDFVVGIATLAGRAVQYGADNSLAGLAGDGLRAAVPEGVKDRLREAGVAGALAEALPSAARGAASNEALARTGTAVRDYLATRAPGDVANDVKLGIGKVWSSVEADHAKAAAQGPEAEARGWGNLVGRVTFEVAATVVPVAGVAGKVAKGADVADAAADAVRIADRTTDALRSAETVDDMADAARLAAHTAEGFGTAADFGIPKVLNPRQSLHTPPVTDGRSVLTENPTELLQRLHDGAFMILRHPKPGQVVVDFGKPIGEYWSNGVKVGETQFGSISFGKNGAHIIPANPNQW